MPLYRLLVSLFALVVAVGALRKGGWPMLSARLGLIAPEKDAPHVWWHGASNGELSSARPVLTRIVQQRPDLHVLVTCNSDTGQALVTGWGLPRVTALPAPVDLSRVTARVLRRWRVVAHVALESEIWPHRFLQCRGPVILLGARMRPGTARVWRTLPRLARRVLSCCTLVSAQDAASLDRLRALGLPENAIGPLTDLKALYDPAAAPMPDAALQAALPRAQTWLAASTHEGEEETVLEAHRLARAEQSDLRLILAPRHAARGDAVEAMVRGAGLGVARRSRGEAPGAAAVYLADTMGEMALWYRLAGRVFIGGTLTDRGGHTPYEPAAFGSALIHGPDVANFADPFARLDAADAALRVTDAAELAEALARLAQPESQAQAGARAAEALRTGTDVETLCNLVLETLPAFRET
ncbi:3-deoxy-D-manno-octulosonic acid transferase [Thetidibacter halocola]|uniref:3-deoxy-D-manno-octulosonic acid transferase n=1 Tax=Thetidibacter halocola TaxID=2827239 RepID=A0A8J7WD08_9RHOB|nr:glycosyltransferase N-terminal domain-containing protein [Thetidibacter halocola]MBS0123128.1 3-deoxy-D-manno-octulosonic acid transferase [Thetidibacter halocola]